MKAIHCQEANQDFSKLSEYDSKKIFNKEQLENLKLNQDKKTINFIEKNQTILKNKRYRDPQNVDIAKHCIIRNINSFFSEYIAFLNNPLYCQVTDKLKNKEDFEFINSNKYVLSHFYNMSKKFSNYGELIANDLFTDFAKQSDIFPNGKEARKVYDRYLFHFVELGKLENNVKDSADPASIQKKMIDFLSYDPSHILEVPVIECNTSDKDEINNLIIEGLKHDLVILRGFLDKFGFNPEYFTEKYIVETYKDQKIEVIEQNPNFYGFTDNFHKRQEWTLSQLGRYLDFKRNNHKYLNAKGLEDLKIDESKIYFGVNLDMDHMETPREEIRSKINPLLNFCAFDDALSYLRETINGMNLPQFYIKENGVWTGGHEENCRIRSININHGPQGSEWYGVRLEDSKIFADYLKKKHDVNIYLKEGLWYENWEYFLKNKLNVLYTVQKAGDIILVGPGCLHWVRSLGNAVHSSWNFFPKEKMQFQTALERYKVNREIKMRSLVPLFTLMIDILNFEMYYLDINLVKYCLENLQEIFKLSNIQNSKILHSPLYSRIPIYKELESQNAVVCENCFDEIFNFWIYAEKFTGIKKDKYDTLMCPACFEREFKYIDQTASLFIAYKYETQELKKLFSRIEKRIDIEEGNYDSKGEIEDEFQVCLIKSNKDTRFNAKIKSEFLLKNKNDENLTVFLNKKNPIFEKISASKILEHIKNNFEVIAYYQKPSHNDFTQQLEFIQNKKLVDLLKGRNKNWAQKINDKNNFLTKEKDLNIEDDKNAYNNAYNDDEKINNIDECGKNNAVSDSDSLLDFYEKANLKLFEGSIEEANLMLNNSRFLKGKNEINNISHNCFINENLNKCLSDDLISTEYNSKIIIPNLIEHQSELETNTQQIAESDIKVIKEQSEVNKKELNNDETISHSNNQENIEEENLIKRSEKNNLQINGNLAEKHCKELYDGIEVNLSNFEIDHSSAKNEIMNKFVIYKNNQNINIAKLSTNEFIKIINKNSNLHSFNKNNDLNDKEFTHKNQRKKLRNSNSHKKPSTQNNSFPLSMNNFSAYNLKANFNNNNNNNNDEFEKDTMIIPFDADVSVKSVDNASSKLAGLMEDLIFIREKIGENLFKEIENTKKAKNIQNCDWLISESEKCFENSIDYDSALSYIHKSLIAIKNKTRNREPFEYLIKKIENKYKPKSGH